MTDLKLKVSTAEQEREFYFNKLRDIEILCQLDEIKSQPVRPLRHLQQPVCQASPGLHMHSAVWTSSSGCAYRQAFNSRRHLQS